jgi:hypothetical protein
MHGPLEEDFEEQRGSSLPPNRTMRAIIIGVIAGVLCAAESVIVTLANAPIYQEASKATGNELSSIATTIAGLACLTFLISLVIYFVAGYITGKVAIVRRLGFLAGLIAGAVNYAASFLKQYIPNYPGNVPASGSPSAGAIVGGFLVIVGFLVVSGLIGGLCGWFGARVATRRHPYYLRQLE